MLQFAVKWAYGCFRVRYDHTNQLVHIHALPPCSLFLQHSLSVAFKLRGLTLTVAKGFVACVFADEKDIQYKRNVVQSKLGFGWKPVLLFHSTVLLSSSLSLFSNWLAHSTLKPHCAFFFYIIICFTFKVTILCHLKQWHDQRRHIHHQHPHHHHKYFCHCCHHLSRCQHYCDDHRCNCHYRHYEINLIKTISSHLLIPSPTLWIQASSEIQNYFWEFSLFHFNTIQSCRCLNVIVLTGEVC